MKFKLKINENTSFQDIRDELDHLKSVNVPEIPFNHLWRIINFLGATEVTSTGSTIRFRSRELDRHPYFKGYFQIHKIHKGGNQIYVKINDYRAFLYKALIAIIDSKEQEQKPKQKY